MNDATGDERSLTASERRRSLFAVIAALAVQSLIFGLSMPLLALVLDAQGVDKTLNGLSAAAQSVAIFAVAPFVSRLIALFGVARLMIGTTLLSIMVFLLLPVFPNVYAWFPLRFLLGLCGAVGWVAGEVWINQIVEERTRGRVIALYSAALAGGMSFGPFVLAQTGTEGWTPYLIVAALTLISAIPLLFAANISPAVKGHPSTGLALFVVRAPSALLLNAVFAATYMAIITFLPIYALNLGLDQATSLYLLTVMAIGGLAMQLPIGWLADHMNRLLLVILCILFTVAGLAAMPFLIAVAAWNMIYIFIFGGVMASLYTLALILLGERFQGADLASATTVFGVMWGLGSIVGPPLGGQGMELWLPHGLPLIVGVLYLAYLPFPVVEYLRRRKP
ncbi:MAG: MFS transporter [Alphaproteobacteria bacterium]